MADAISMRDTMAEDLGRRRGTAIDLAQGGPWAGKGIAQGAFTISGRNVNVVKSCSWRHVIFWQICCKSR
jgi:hypothetical protein